MTKVDAEQLKNLTDAIKNIVLTFAILVGGAWTLYTFRSMAQERQARSTIANIEAATANADAQRREAELKAQDFPLAVELTTRGTNVRGRRQIYVVATLRNPGAGPLLLTFREPMFRLARITKIKSGRTVTLLAHGRALYLSSNGVKDVPSRRLLGQQTRRIPCMFDVSSSGDYLVQVNVHYRDESDANDDTFAFEQEIVHVR
jgi:hypothetical protein